MIIIVLVVVVDEDDDDDDVQPSVYLSHNRWRRGGHCPSDKSLASWRNDLWATGETLIPTVRDFYSKQK